MTGVTVGTVLRYMPASPTGLGVVQDPSKLLPTLIYSVYSGYSQHVGCCPSDGWLVSSGVCWPSKPESPNCAVGKTFRDEGSGGLYSWTVHHLDHSPERWTCWKKKDVSDYGWTSKLLRHWRWVEERGPSWIAGEEPRGWDSMW